MNKQNLGLIVGLLLASCAVHANQVYSWTDENGVVHFSQHPPSDGRQTSEVTVRAPRQQVKPVDAPAVLTVTEVISRYEEPTPAEQLALEADQFCQQSRDNMALLEQDNEVRIEEADGSKRVLSKKERAEEIDLARGHIEIYCKSLANQ